MSAPSGQDATAETLLGPTQVGAPLAGLEAGGARDGAGQELPRRIGRYAILRELGRGAMGVVYAGYDERLDRKVAIKVVSKLAEASEVRVLREAQSLAKLSDPNVVAIYEADEWPGRGVYIVMEFVPGKTLRDAPGDDVKTIVSRYRQAASGLSAAHAAGIVHRDFKPDNALVGEDGRVRVVDFGLARGTDAVEEQDALPSEGVAASGLDGEVPSDPGTAASSTTKPPRGAIEASSGSTLRTSQSALGLTLTQTGAVLGTPAYMAPEQHRGLAATARSDQFAWCVALYEAIYGERPFRGDSRVSLAFNVVSGRMIDPPHRRDVPPQVRDVLMRGLSNEPSGRYEDFAELLSVLDTDPREVRRRRLAVGGGVLAVAAVATGLFMARPDIESEEPPCVRAAAPFDEVWNPARAEAITAAFVATELPYSEDVAVRVRAVLDGHATRWRAAATEACEATYVHETQSERLLDARGSCLERARRRFDGLARAYETADVEVVKHATESLGVLADLDRCADGAALLVAVPPPPPEVAPRVERARGLLSEARALTGASSFDLAQQRIGDAEEAIDGVDFPAVRAELAFATGMLAMRRGAHVDARDHFERGYYGAVRGRDDELAARTAARVLDVSREHLSDGPTAERWRPHAQAQFDRLRGHGPIPSDMLLDEIIVFDGVGEDTGEDARWDAAISRLESEPTSKLQLALVLNKRGGQALGRGDYDGAARLWGRTVELATELHGEEHPLTATLQVNYAIALSLHADHARAVETAIKAETVLKRSLPDDHPYFASISNNLAEDLTSLGRLDEAHARGTDALARYVAAYGESHMKVAGALSGLGRIEMYRGNLDAAVEHLQSAEAMWAQTGTYPAGRIPMLLLLGDAYLRRGDVEAAKTAYETADEIRVEDSGADDWRRFESLVGLAEVAFAIHAYEDAEDLLERARKHAAMSGATVEPAARARLLAISAKVAEASGNLDGARGFASDARAAFDESSPLHAGERRAFVDWTARLGPRRGE